MKNLSFIIVTFLFSFGVASAQDTGTDNHQVTVGVTEHALIDIESTGDLNFSLSPAVPTEAGLGLSFDNDEATNSNLWLNYSSIVSSTGAKNKVIVNIDQNLPTGLKLQLAVADPSGGEGETGSSMATAGSEKTLSTDDQQIVHNIGSCYTGNGSGSGCQLTYSLISDGSVDYENIVADNKDITVTYTITSQTGGGNGN